MVFGLGTEELLLVAAIFLMFFGATAIPKLARSMGRAKGEFQKARTEFEREASAAQNETLAPPPAAPSESQVRQTARGLGIDEAGKPVDEVKRLIQQKLA